ncbi:ParA family protein [Streptomyces sp. NPDC091204]|uniref:ParA family protein n=1 Tax=Streptomyces sp. NPDC091204 TaxID=3155299 RepID=UPI003413A039
MVQVVLEPLKIPDRLRMPTVFEREWTEPANKLRPRILLPAAFTGPSPIAPGEHRVFIVFNRKGGAGKTTTTLELACAWAAMGYTVRIIDADATCPFAVATRAPVSRTTEAMASIRTQRG